MSDATEETTRGFLARYYVSKKRRYLKDPDTAAEMITGTPHDWEDAGGYAEAVKREER
ncbi:MAG: hypothetical protein V2J24_01775 [Pseudomonadales bacterium]|jgi:hypothetical protein|nr:hypothetical protein [Pseudomonadales bacterium]